MFQLFLQSFPSHFGLPQFHHLVVRVLYYNLQPWNDKHSQRQHEIFFRNMCGFEILHHIPNKNLQLLDIQSSSKGFGSNVLIFETAVSLEKWLYILLFMNKTSPSNILRWAITSSYQEERERRFLNYLFNFQNNIESSRDFRLKNVFLIFDPDLEYIK